jgi:medium-chain acyl-CoA synthetase
MLHQHSIHTFCAAPSVYRQLVSTESQQIFRQYPPKVLQHCVSAGESLEARVILLWHELTEGLMIWDGYGQSETTILCANYASIPRRQGSMGKPLPGVPLYVMDEHGEIAAPYEEGDIAIKLDEAFDEDPSERFWGLFDGYLQDDGSCSRPEYEGEDGSRWYITGDRGHVDEDGYFWYKGRSDDIIISAGYRIGESSRLT